jgi:hypothetical protein
MLAGDLVRSYLQRNPKTAFTVHEINDIVLKLRGLAHVNESVAERVIRSVIHELSEWSGDSSIDLALNSDNK